jgi:uncharacterized membrane protein
MNIVLWVVTGVLAAAFLATGLMKLTQSKEKLAARAAAWTDDFSQRSIRAIGVVEILGVIGLVLPAPTGVATVLVPVAACGLVLVMVGAAITHLRRHEPQLIVVNLVLAVLALVVAWGRFGPYPLAS